ncbi:MAG TPA: hemerythrin domain-containing protein [Geobacteraceae bacterium]|nr:hemerythrin domain-containing protein [Geobacteraceae bacterium]
MKQDITSALVAEHVLIKRMLALIEKFAPLTAKGDFTDWQFYLDGADFIRQYADRFHHAKEEDILFEALVTNGMPRQNSPVAAMLMEHDLGRIYVKEFDTAAREAQAGASGREETIAANALAYAALLRDHIAKEDDILYPLAERVIPEGMRDTIVAGYEKAEAAVAGEFTERYARIVAKYEAIA